MRTSAKKRTQQKKRGSSVRQPMASIRSSSRPCLLDVERPGSSSRRPEFSSSKAGNYSRKRTCKRRIWIKLCVKKILSCKTFSSWNKRVVFHTKNAWKLRTANKDKIRKNSESDVPAKTTAARRGSSRPAFSTSVDQPPARGDQSSSAGQPTITRGLRNELRTHKKNLEHAAFFKKLLEACCCCCSLQIYLFNISLQQYYHRIFCKNKMYVVRRLVKTLGNKSAISSVLCPTTSISSRRRSSCPSFLMANDPPPAADDCEEPSSSRAGNYCTRR